MLAYVDDEHYRRRILTQLNRGESRHSVARAVFMASVANSGNVTAKAKKDQLGALRLVVNAIVLWNALYMAVALKELSRVGYEVYPEDVARLSPLIHRHLNFQGRHAFVLPEAVAQGQLRPLRGPRQEL